MRTWRIKPDDKLRVGLCCAGFCSLDATMVEPSRSQLAIVTSSGDVWWIPAMKFRTFCSLDLTHFPFDEHRCFIQIITWTYHGHEVD